MHVWYYIGYAEIMVTHGDTKYTLDCVIEQLKSIFLKKIERFVIIKMSNNGPFFKSMWYQL